MATFDAAVEERSRLMSRYLGCSARVVRFGAAYGVQLHDIRPSGIKTGVQRVVSRAGGWSVAASDWLTWYP